MQAPNKFERAIELARPLVDLDPTDAAAQTTLGIAYRETGDHTAARRAFEAALQISPFDPAVRCGLEAVYEHLRETKLAQREREACAGLQQ